MKRKRYGILELTGCFCLFLFAFSLLVFVPTTVKAQSGPTVETSYGELRGIVFDAKTVAWLGVPFAKPPVAELRWKAPQEPDSWSGIREADQYSDPCVQHQSDGSIIGNEDCLYLNIWRQSGDIHDRPVFVWIHGGGNNGGQGSSPEFEGADLAAKDDMIVVTIDYRLGPIGWLTHPALKKGVDPASDSGNYGILDQVAALTWVRDNISAFGGDPGNVTVAGESAGGIDILTLLVSPLARGLFQRAIVESGFHETRTMTQGEQLTDDLICRLLINDGTVADQEAAEQYLQQMSNEEIEGYLRSKNGEELVDGTASPPPTTLSYEDGYVVPEQASGKFASGDYTQVPIIIGSNRDETKLFGVFLYTTFIDTYGYETGNMLWEKVTYYTSLWWKIKAVDELAAQMSRHQNNVYTYLFAWDKEPPPFDYLLGACHALEIPFVFHTFDKVPPALRLALFGPENLLSRTVLSNNIMTYWGQFAKTGDPNNDDLWFQFKWNPWQNDSPSCITLDTWISDSTDEATEEKMFAELATESDLVQEVVMSYLVEMFDSEVQEPGF